MHEHELWTPNLCCDWWQQQGGLGTQASAPPRRKRKVMALERNLAIINKGKSHEEIGRQSCFMWQLVTILQHLLRSVRQPYYEELGVCSSSAKELQCLVLCYKSNFFLTSILNVIQIHSKVHSSADLAGSTKFAYDMDESKVSAIYVLGRRIMEKDMPKGLRTRLHYWPVLMSLGHVSLCLFIEVKNHI